VLECGLPTIAIAQAASILKVYKSCKAFTFRDPHPDVAGREMLFKVRTINLVQTINLLNLTHAPVLQAFFDVPSLTVRIISFRADPSLYLEHEREMFMLRNGDWERGRDRLANTVFHSLLEFLAPLKSRSQPLAVLRTTSFSNDTFVLTIETVALMAELMGAMDEECVRQAGAAGDVYVLQKKPGSRSRVRDSIFFHIRLPVYLHYAPSNDTGDVSTILCHAAKVHRGHTEWDTLA
jgi:hypothetical protein